jgi:hypothetical protein
MLWGLYGRAGPKRRDFETEEGQLTWNNAPPVNRNRSADLRARRSFWPGRGKAHWCRPNARPLRDTTVVTLTKEGKERVSAPTMASSPIRN